MSFHSAYHPHHDTTTTASSARLGPQTTARIAREVRELMTVPESGVYLIVDVATGVPHSLQELTAEMEGPADTPYVGKYFLLRFTFGPDFPITPPTAHFLTKVYHPNVDISTGAICVNTLKRDWKSSHTMKHCLAVIRCLLLEPFPESSLNEEAGKFFMESYQEYYNRTQLHADIHGRKSSVKPIVMDDDVVAKCENNSYNKTATSASSTVNNNNIDETTRGILKHTSHNTTGGGGMAPIGTDHHSNNTNHHATAKNSSHPNKSTPSSNNNNKSNLIKKKSLKRL